MGQICARYLAFTGKWTTQFLDLLEFIIGQLEKYNGINALDSGSTALFMFYPLSCCSCCDIRDLCLEFKMFSQLSLSFLLFKMPLPWDD